MKYLILSIFLFGNIHSISHYDYELNSLIAEFKSGVDNEQSFNDLAERFRDLEDEIEEFHESEKTSESKKLYRKSMALTALVGELSPDSRNWDLTIKKYEVAAPILGVDAYIHKPMEGQEEYCLTITHFYLWDDNYQTILIFNDNPSLYTYKSESVCTTNTSSEYVTSKKSNAGVGCKSLRQLNGAFVTKNGAMYLEKIECTKTPSCYDHF